MKILITGGAGFIGSHIADAYIKKGHSVSIIDNLSTGDKKNINPKARFYRGDIKNRAFVERVIGKERPVAINHQAALASIRLAVSRPHELIDSNIAGTLNILLSAGKHKVKRFIFASSCSVLGHPAKLPTTESTPTSPLSPYAFTKYANEEMIKFYAPWSKFEYIIFRYSNVYGPRQSTKGEAGVVPIFVKLMKQGKQPHIFGDGSKTRDYIYVDDVVQANMLALTKGKNRIIGLGTGIETSDQGIFSEIERNMKTNIRPIYEPFRTWEIRRMSLTAGHARKVLGWQPTVAVRDGIKRTVDSMRY